jgi:hypothetical protein
MVRYLMRELAGWGLIALALSIFYKIYLFCMDPVEHRQIEEICLAFIGIFIFRGGIHLLKMAVAARICREAQERLYPVSGADAQHNRTRERPRKPELYSAGSNLTKRA